MVADYCPGSNQFQAEPPESPNGTQPYTSTIESDGHQDSDTLRTIKAGLNAWAMWQELDALGKLTVILTHYSAAQWLEPEELQVLASFRHQPPGKWAQIKLKYREIGGNPYDLQWAVDQHLTAQEGTGHDTDPALCPATSCWARAQTAADFLLQDDPDVPADARDLLVPGCITLVAAPRASGKSLVALYLAVALAHGGVFRGEQVPTRRVLLVDRDNPSALIRKRLRWLGAHQVTGLKVLTRDQAPPLTDAAAWAAFPVAAYDVVIVDSIGAATEGVSEKEGKQTQQYLATLKDLARRGPAVLALDNKPGQHILSTSAELSRLDVL